MTVQFGRVSKMKTIFGTVWIGKKNLSTILVSEGFAIPLETVSINELHNALEKSRKSRKLVITITK